jgi:hypothetical protein
MGVSLEGLFRREVAPALLERNAFDKIKDEIRKTVTAFAHPIGNLVKLESVSQQLFGQATDKGFLSAMDYESLEFESSGKGFSGRQLPCGIYWIASIQQTPTPYRIVVLQGKSNGIHRNVARCA